VRVTNRIGIGGSWVKIKDKSGSLFDKSTRDKKDKKLGVATDVFLMVKIYESEKYKIDITSGGFNPVLWEPKDEDWYPTYSIDIKIK
jgi:hypothetical protein